MWSGRDNAVEFLVWGEADAKTRHHYAELYAGAYVLLVRGDNVFKGRSKAKPTVLGD